jgi:hypothetical protein
MDTYFEALKTPQLTGTGQRRDRFSFTYPTDKWKALAESAVDAGYGIEWKLTSATPPRQIRIAFIEPGSPAELAGWRGATSSSAWTAPAPMRPTTPASTG